MLSSRQPPRLRAVIDHSGVLTVTGLPTHAEELVVDHDEPGNAYAELINLCLDAADRIGGPVWLHADTPTGVWGMAVHVDGVTVPLPLEVFDTPDPTPPADDSEVAGLVEALATVGALTPPSADIVLALAADPAPAVRAAATAELATWADDPDTVIDTHLDETQLAALADSRLDWIRAGVAAHPASDPLTLQRLAGDRDHRVVQALAGRLDLPAALATELVTHPEPLVRAELGRNPATTFMRAAADDAVPAPGSIAVLTNNPPPPGSPSPGPAVPATPAPVRKGPRSAPTRPAQTSHRPDRGRGARRWLTGGLAVAGLLAAGATATSALIGGPADPPPAPASAAAQAAVPWHGTWLPAGPDGPADPAAATASGFGQSPAGAAMAAAHLGVRIDAYAGPASFEPTIRTQTYGGDPQALLGRTRAAYTRAATDAGIRDGGPIPTSSGRITGWRVSDWTAEGPVPVHLLVAAPAGGLLDFAITVAWIDGDYRLVDPTAAGTFVTTPVTDPSDYTPF